MKCLLCNKYSFLHICKRCQYNFLTPSIYHHRVDKIEIISFYKYDDIRDLIHTKYSNLGYNIYRILAALSFKKFANTFTFSSKISSIAIDDKVDKNYSHSAILNQKLKSKYIKPQYNTLIANSNIKYANKHYDFKVKNPRNFIYSGKNNIDAILVDDIITDGFTIKEAKQALDKRGVNTLFGVVLCHTKDSKF